MRARDALGAVEPAVLFEDGHPGVNGRFHVVLRTMDHVQDVSGDALED